MSLYVSLISKTSISKKGTGVFVRDSGGTRELSFSEVKEKYPDSDIEEKEFETNEVFDYNITHNLTDMAEAAGIYRALWRPEEIDINTASQLIPILADGLNKLLSSPDA